MNRNNQKLSFQKKSFRVLDTRQLAHIKGGEMVLDGDGGFRQDDPSTNQGSNR